MAKVKSDAVGDAALVESVVGKHFLYTYDNGWGYELYGKNEHTIDVICVPPDQLPVGYHQRTNGRSRSRRLTWRM